MTKHSFLSLLLMACAIPGWGQAVRILTADKGNDYGIVYSLPQTALEVEISIRHDVYVAGPYYKYAKKSIGSSDVISENSDKWSIADVKVRPYGVTDSGIQYVMQLKPGSTSFIAVDPDGMLLSINKEVAPPAARNAGSLQKENSPVIPTGKEYINYVNEDFVASQSSARQAQILAEQLMEVRDAKLSLTRGTADQMPSDGKQMELMLASLDRQETALARAFTGSMTTEYVTRKYSVVPDGDSKEVLFRLSEFVGPVDAEDLSGDPVYIEFQTVNDAKMPVDAKGEPKKLPKDAIIYAIPGSAQVNISTLGKTLYQKELQFAQFGMTFGLNPSLFSDKKEPSYAVFDPVTGALLDLGSLK